MDRITKWAAVAVVLMLATMVVACGRPDPTGLTLKSGLRTQVGGALQVEPYLEYFGYEGAPTADQAAADRTQLQWSVQPSDGASISSAGVLKASKPGVYTVTVKWDARGHLSASTKVYVAAPDSTTTTEESGEEPTTTEETEEESTTTEATVGSAFAGTYKGTMPLDMGSNHADVPWGFTVDDEGNVKGGLDYAWDALTRTVLSFTGQVSDAGLLTASGEGTTTVMVNGSPKGGSSPVLLSGKITGALFSGAWGGEEGKTGEVRATRE